MRCKSKKERRGRGMPSRGTVTLSKDALIDVTVESINMGVKVNELVNSIITDTNWKDSMGNLKFVIMERRKLKREESDVP